MSVLLSLSVVKLGEGKGRLAALKGLGCDGHVRTGQHTESSL